MPSFTFDWEDSLVRIFESLGMTDAFTFGVADFSGINGELNLAITEILHKAFVLVDEKGTEAAAATAVIIGETAIMEPEVEIIINHPFIFLIRDRDTGAILFLGRVLNPDQ
jgi:serpin B